MRLESLERPRDPVTLPIPLRDRGAHGPWTSFEAKLFALVTMEGNVPGYFSARLDVVQAMLDAYTAAVTPCGTGSHD